MCAVRTEPGRYVTQDDPRSGFVWSVSRLVPLLLIGAVMFNLATFGDYARSQGDRRGFRVGQSDDLADRVRTSGRPLLNEEWHVHLRIGDLLDDEDRLDLPASHPLDTRLLEYFADVRWRSTGDEAWEVRHGELATHLKGAQTWTTDDGVPIALIEGSPEGERFRLAAVVGSPDVRWVVAPEAILADIAGGSVDDG